MKTLLLLLSVSMLGFYNFAWALSEEDKLQIAVRSIVDISQLDITDVFTNQGVTSAVCYIEGKGTDDVGTTDESSQIARIGEIVILAPLNTMGPARSQISYQINLKAGVGHGTREDEEQFSPFRVEDKILCVARWPKNAKLNPLVQFPRVYLITPDFQSSLEHVGVKTLSWEFNNQPFSQVAIDSVVRLANSGNEALAIASFNAFLNKGPLHNLDEVNKFLEVADKETIGAVVMYALLEQGDTEAVRLAASAILSHLSKARDNIILRDNIVLALIAARMSGPLDTKASSALLQEVIRSLKAEPLTDKMKVVLPLLGG